MSFASERSNRRSPIARRLTFFCGIAATATMLAGNLFPRRPSIFQSYDHFAEQASNPPVHIPLVHVISPFKVRHCNARFCPFDQAQSIVLESMKRAKQNTKASVTLAAVTFPDELDIVPEGFLALPPLSRSTATEYEDLNINGEKERLPFMQDIFDRLQNSNVSYQYVVYSNSDIIVRDDFYDVVLEKIQEGYDAFTINRKIVSAKDPEGDPYTKSDLDEIYGLPWESHPGSDCFVFSKSIADQLNLGNSFSGFLFSANPLLVHLETLGENFHAFETHELGATYHLGDDRNWSNVTDPEVRAYTKKNAENVYKLDHLWKMCANNRNSWACIRLKKKFRKIGYEIDCRQNSVRCTWGTLKK